MAHLTGAPRAQYVHRLFARIAERYDLVNAVMSMGWDRCWRRSAAQLAMPCADGLALDLATGTGAQAVELLRAGAGSVVGVDFSAPMLALGRRKIERAGMHRQITMMMGDAHALPFPDGVFSCATVAFGVRNFAYLERAYTELRRVVRPGGRVVCLEFQRPFSGPSATLYRMYLRGVVPLMGEWLGGDREAYYYLSSSVQRFLTADQLQLVMERAGLRSVACYPLHFGAITIHVGLA